MIWLAAYYTGPTKTGFAIDQANDNLNKNPYI